MAGIKDTRRGLVETLLGLLGGETSIHPKRTQGSSGRRGASGSRHGLSGMKPSVKSNRATSVDVDRFKEISGVGQDWARTVYGEYYATSVPIYSAIKIRSDALARTPLLVLSPSSSDAEGANSSGSGHTPGEPGRGRDRRAMFPQMEPVSEAHPVHQLLDRVNRWYTRGELWRATEIYLNLWGSAFWALERDDQGRWEIWPLRPDRVRILPDKQKYIKGYVYSGMAGPVAYTTEEMIWIRYFNPMEEHAGLSPVAPLRLSADMGLDALKFNRNFFRNSAQPDVIFTTDEAMTDQEVEDFYQRWETRYKGPGNAHRPAIASFIRDIKTMGFNHREMEFIQGLRWSLEDVSRVYGVPMPLLSDLQRATYSNINVAERLFWRNTMVPEMKLLEEQLNEKLLPLLGYGDLRVEFDLRAIEALQETETERVEREVKLLDRGVLTINEVRRRHHMPDVTRGDAPWSRSTQRGASMNVPVWPGTLSTKGNGSREDSLT